jgi:hypothetical protein
MSLGRTGYIWEDTIKMDLTGIWTGFNWLRNEWQILVRVRLCAFRHHGQNNPFWAMACLRRFCQSYRSSGFHFFGFRNNIFFQSKVVSPASNPQLGGPGLCIYVPSDRVAQLYPKALGSLFVTFYDTQCCSGGRGGILTVLTRLDTGRLSSFRDVFMNAAVVGLRRRQRISASQWVYAMELVGGN